MTSSIFEVLTGDPIEETSLTGSTTSGSIEETVSSIIYSLVSGSNGTTDSITKGSLTTGSKNADCIEVTGSTATGSGSTTSEGIGLTATGSRVGGTATGSGSATPRGTGLTATSIIVGGTGSTATDSGSTGIGSTATDSGSTTAGGTGLTATGFSIRPTIFGSIEVIGLISMGSLNTGSISCLTPIGSLTSSTSCSKIAGATDLINGGSSTTGFCARFLTTCSS